MQIPIVPGEVTEENLDTWFPVWNAPNYGAKEPGGRRFYTPFGNVFNARTTSPPRATQPCRLRPRLTTPPPTFQRGNVSATGEVRKSAPRLNKRAAPRGCG